jgi:hypothetical protein
MKNYQVELARLRESAHARREAMRACRCGQLIIIEGEPTIEQRATLDARVPCALHVGVCNLIEVPAMPDWMKTGTTRPSFDVADENLI